MSRSRITSETMAKAIIYVNAGIHMCRVAEILGISTTSIYNITWAIKEVPTKADLAKGRECTLKLLRLYETLGFIVVDKGGSMLEIIGCPIMRDMAA